MANKKIEHQKKFIVGDYLSPRNKDQSIYFSIFNQAAEAILIIKDGKFLACNKAAELLFNRSCFDIIGKYPADLSPKYQPDGTLSSDKAKVFIEKVKKGIPQTLEWAHSRPDKSIFIAKISLNTFCIQDQQYVTVFINDISDYLKRNSELELYQSDLEIIVKEKTENQERLNEELTATVKELTVTNKELNNTNEELKRIIQEYQREKKITKDLQALLRSSQLKLKSFISQSADGIVIVDHDAKIIEWNQKMVEITGIDYESAIYKKIYDIEFLNVLKHSHSVDKYEKIKEIVLSYISNIENAKIKTIEGEIETPNGETKFISTTIFPIIVERIKLIGYIIKDITLRKKQTNELEFYQKHLEELIISKTKEVYDLSRQFNELFDNSSDSIFFMERRSDSKFLLNRINAQGMKVMKMDPLRLFPIDIDLFVTNEKKETLVGYLNKCLNEGKSLTYEESISFPVNDSIWSTTLIPFKDQHGQYTSVAGFSRNITIAKQIKEVEDFMSELYRSTQSLILVFNPEGQIVSINNKFEKLTGYSFNDLKGIEFWNHPVILEEDKIVFKKHFTEILQNTVDTFELYANCKTIDNVPKWIYLRVTCIRNLDGQLKYLIGTGIDLTERKQYELMLKESENQFRSLYETMNDALVILQPNFESNGKISDFLILSCNPAFESFIGKSSKKLKGASILNQFHKSLRNELKGSLSNVYFSGTSTKLGATDNDLNKSFSASIFYSDKVHIAILLRDITEHKAIENALITSERKFRNIFESSEDGIAIISLELRLLQSNPALQIMLATNNEQLYQGTIYGSISPTYYEVVEQSIQNLMNQRTISNLEIELLAYDGRKFPVEISARLIDYEETHAILVIVRDITERKELQKTILQTIIDTEERERKRLADNLHDEIGPLLASLKMYLSTLQQKLKESEYNEILDIIMNLVKTSVDNVRTISNNISPHLLERYGLASAIEAEVENTSFLLPVSFKTNIVGYKFERTVEIIYYRILKELLNNTIKYANAKHVNIILEFYNSKLFLEYVDDGKGFDIDEIEKGVYKGQGLFNIVNRIKSIDGRCSYITSSGKGFKFTLNAKTELR